jgi:tetratricopeptide (TPR) repeat protein
LQTAGTLTPRFPRNYLLMLEEANLLRASGKYREAEEQYRRVWQNGREGKYGSLHYEIAALGLGDLLHSEKNYPAAATAYELVTDVSTPDPELLQKADLGAGEMYDQMQKRDMAMKKYQSVLATNAGNDEAEKARRRMKEAYRE